MALTIGGLLPAPLQAAAKTLLTDSCYDTLLEKHQFLDVPCVSLAASKAISLGILAAGMIIKVPQILVILKNRRAMGLNLIGLLLEVVTYCISITYNYRSVEAPFTTYGEAVFILLQDIIIVYLILHYNKQAGVALLSVPLSLGLLVGLQYIPLALVQTLQLAAIPATTASRLPQIYTNWKNGHTGDLSAITVFGFALGSIARIFTSLKEAPDPIVLAGFAITSGVNIFMAMQVVYYRGRAPAAKAIKKTPKMDVKEDVSTATTTATTSPPLRARARKT